MYVHFTTTITHFTNACILACSSSMAAFSFPWTLTPLLLAGFSATPRCAIKVLCTLQGVYNRLRGLVQCPKAYSSKTPPRLVWTV